MERYHVKMDYVNKSNNEGQGNSALSVTDCQGRHESNQLTLSLSKLNSSSITHKLSEKMKYNQIHL